MENYKIYPPIAIFGAFLATVAILCLPLMLFVVMIVPPFGLLVFIAHLCGIYAGFGYLRIYSNPEITPRIERRIWHCSKISNILWLIAPLAWLVGNVCNKNSHSYVFIGLSIVWILLLLYFIRCSHQKIKTVEMKDVPSLL